MGYIRTVIFLAALTALLIFLGDLIGGRQGAIIGLIFAGIMNFGSYWFSDRIVLAMYGAKQVTESEAPELYRTVRELTGRAGLPMPKVYIIHTETPNAFATGRNPQHSAVAVTSGIMRLLSREELSGVIAHELSHIKNRDVLISTIAATIAGAISYLSHMALWFSMFGGRDSREGANPFVLIVMLIIAPIAAMLIQMAISRSREFVADKDGAQIVGNPLYLADALRKLGYYNKRVPMQDVNEATAHMFIVSPLSGDTVVKLFSTHPPLEERIKRLEAMALSR